MFARPINTLRKLLEWRLPNVNPIGLIESAYHAGIINLGQAMKLEKEFKVDEFPDSQTTWWRNRNCGINM